MTLRLIVVGALVVAVGCSSVYALHPVYDATVITEPRLVGRWTIVAEQQHDSEPPDTFTVTRDVVIPQSGIPDSQPTYTVRPALAKGTLSARLARIGGRTLVDLSASGDDSGDSTYSFLSHLPAHAIARLDFRSDTLVLTLMQGAPLVGRRRYPDLARDTVGHDVVLLGSTRQLRAALARTFADSALWRDTLRFVRR